MYHYNTDIDNSTLREKVHETPQEWKITGFFFIYTHSLLFWTKASLILVENCSSKYTEDVREKLLENSQNLKINILQNKFILKFV